MEIFKGIKPNPYPLKRDKGKLGYGYLCKRTKGRKVTRKKALRKIRKYGFDVSETWNLYITIASWLSDNVGGFFRKCGYFEDWSDYDLDGKPYKDSTLDDIDLAVATRKHYFIGELDNFLHNGDRNLVKRFIQFVVPRIEYFAKNAQGYPLTVASFEKWQECLDIMAKMLKNFHRSTDFLIYYFSLWD